ncbi:MAG: hypothetical protein V1907_02145 [Candidatus Kerfeldbacteria bacterium]
MQEALESEHTHRSLEIGEARKETADNWAELLVAVWALIGDVAHPMYEKHGSATLTLTTAENHSVIVDISAKAAEEVIRTFWSAGESRARQLLPGELMDNVEKHEHINLHLPSAYPVTVEVTRTA